MSENRRLYLPLVRRIPLHLREPQIGERSRGRLLIVSEVADQSIGVSVAGVAECDRKVSQVIAGEIEDAGPLAAGRFTIFEPLVVNTKLETVITVRDRKIVCKRRLDVVVARLHPKGRAN